MAYIQQTPEEEKNKFGRTGDTTPNPLPPQSGGSSGSAGTGTNAAPGVGTSTQFGSSAAKLSDYLKANESQVQDFGNKVAGNLTQGYNDTMNTVNQGFGDFNKSVNQGWTQPNQEKINSAASDPTQFAKDPNNVKDFQSWYNNQYTGPQSFETSEPYQNINNSVGKAVENANLTKSFSGLGSYLNNFMETGSNTPGMNTLDTALLQRNPGASASIKQAATPYEGLNQYLGTKTQEGNQNIASAQNQANQSRESLQNQFTGKGGVIPNFESDLNSRVQAMRNQATGYTNPVLDTLKNYNTQTYGQLTPQNNEALGGTAEQRYRLAQYNDALSKFGNVTDNSGNPYYNMSNFDLSNYATPLNPESSITNENTATADDYARYAALQSLTGGQNMNFLNPENSSKASGAKPDLVDFNIEQALGDRNSQLNNSFNQYVKEHGDTGPMAQGDFFNIGSLINRSVPGSGTPTDNTPSRPFTPLPVGGGQTPTPTPTDANGMPIDEEELNRSSYSPGGTYQGTQMGLV